MRSAYDFVSLELSNNKAKWWYTLQKRVFPNASKVLDEMIESNNKDLCVDVEIIRKFYFKFDATSITDNLVVLKIQEKDLNNIFLAIEQDFEAHKKCFLSCVGCHNFGKLFNSREKPQYIQDLIYAQDMRNEFDYFSGILDEYELYLAIEEKT